MRARTTSVVVTALLVAAGVTGCAKTDVPAPLPPLATAAATQTTRAIPEPLTAPGAVMTGGQDVLAELDTGSTAGAGGLDWAAVPAAVVLPEAAEVIPSPEPVSVMDGTVYLRVPATVPVVKSFLLTHHEPGPAFIDVTGTDVPGKGAFMLQLVASDRRYQATFTAAPDEDDPDRFTVVMVDWTPHAAEAATPTGKPSPAPATPSTSATATP